MKKLFVVLVSAIMLMSCGEGKETVNIVDVLIQQSQEKDSIIAVRDSIIVQLTILEKTVPELKYELIKLKTKKYEAIAKYETGIVVNEKQWVYDSTYVSNKIIKLINEIRCIDDYIASHIEEGKSTKKSEDLIFNAKNRVFDLKEDLLLARIDKVNLPIKYSQRKSRHEYNLVNTNSYLDLEILKLTNQLDNIEVSDTTMCYFDD